MGIRQESFKISSDPIKRVKLLEQMDFQRIVPGTQIVPYCQKTL